MIKIDGKDYQLNNVLKFCMFSAWASCLITLLGDISTTYVLYEKIDYIPLILSIFWIWLATELYKTKMYTPVKCVEQKTDDNPERNET